MSIMGLEEGGWQVCIENRWVEIAPQRKDASVDMKKADGTIARG